MEWCNVVKLDRQEGKKMNIININSNISITSAQISFIEEVVKCDFDIENTFYWLSKNIPIFLLNEESMKKYDENKEYVYEQNSDYKPYTEWLGFYGRDSQGLFSNTPRIAICPERIAACVKNDEEFMFLLAKVIVHELAHAKMDDKNQNKSYKTKDSFWKWMEESSANRYTLQIFENFTQQYRYSRSNQASPFRNTSWEDTLFDFIVDFIKRQPPEYALGYELFKKRPILDWEWEREKSNLGGKKQEKNDFINYVKTNYKNIDEKKFQFLFI